MEINSSSSNRIKTWMLYDAEIPLLGIYSRKTLTHFHQSLCIRILIAILYVRSRDRGKIQMPTRIHKLLVIYHIMSIQLGREKIMDTAR